MDAMQVFSHPRIRIVLVDNHEIIRTGIRLLLETELKAVVVGEAGNRCDAIAITQRFQPDLILLELAVGAESGVDYIPGLLQACRTARLLILTDVDDADVHLTALKRGALGVVLKTDSKDTLLKAINKVLCGEVWLARVAVAELLTSLFGSSKKECTSEHSRIDSLTRREREVIGLVTEGRRNRQIASQLAISEVTVRHHLTSIFAKLELGGRFELLSFAHKHGLLVKARQISPSA